MKLVKLSGLLRNRYSFSVAQSVMEADHEIFRKPFKVLDQSDLSYFGSILSPNQIMTDKSELQPFNSCWRDKNQGKSELVLFPKTTEQVSKILKYCNEKNLAVNPQGGNTGLVGGSIPVFDEIILSMKLMNKIENYNEVSSVIGVEAGCILEKLNDFLDDHGVEIPLDLGAKGSCLIGGNAATNAGGKYVVKYGPFRSHILGMEAVLPNGEILNMRSQILKDNTGYDLKDLFIGSEGTLGIITKLDINCPRVDINRRLLVLKFESYDQIIESIPILKKGLGRSLNAMEYMDEPTYACVVKNLHHSVIEMDKDDHLLLVELSVNDEDQIEQLMEMLPPVKDALLSSSDKEYKNIWRVREDVATAAKMEGLVHSYDVSFDVKDWPELLKMLRAKYTRNTAILGYGHIGDGNLHINVCVKKDSGEKEINEEEIFQYVVDKKGSMSAEHGIGIHKPHFLSMQKSQPILGLYKQIKSVFDPKGILNPYKVLP